MKNLIINFLIWRFWLLLIALLAVIAIPTFGAQFPYYQSELVKTGFPEWIWGFGNFDGVHYLRLAREGYVSANSQAFFPLFPLLISSLADNSSYFVIGLILPTLFFFFGLFFFYKLLLIDFAEKIAQRTILLLLVYPTAFFFAAIYSESLFFLLTVITFFFLRTKKFGLATIFIILASLTRIIGVFLIVALFIELFLELKKSKHTKNYLKLFYLPISALGILIYMTFLWINFGDPLLFFNVQPQFGAERSTSLVLLPQVLFRYFKILISLPITSYTFFISLLELFFTIVPLGVLILFWKKIRLSYLAFSLGCLLLPTLTGTLSSMPRYSLMTFLVLPCIAQNLNSKLFYSLLVIFGLLQIILTSLFLRGYWVS